MSEENPHKPEDQDTTYVVRGDESQAIESLSLSVNRATNEILVKDAAGNVVLELKQPPKETQPKKTEAREDRKPLTGDQFREALDKLERLGITWTADVPPIPIFKEREKGQFSKEEYSRIQRDYPTFPRELVALAFYELIGSKISETIIGNEEEVQQKVAILNERLFTPQFRSDFFFKFAIKVPYFEDVDWEVVIKAYERGVKNMPKTPYVLLNLILRNPIDITVPLLDAVNEEREAEFITVAANEYLLDKLIEHLMEARGALEKAKKATLQEAEIVKEEQDNGNR